MTPEIEKLKALIEPLLDNFDWEAVLKCMSTLDHKWRTPPTELHDGELYYEAPQFPTFNRLRTTARGLLQSVAAGREGDTTETGGLIAMRSYQGIRLLYCPVEGDEELEEESETTTQCESHDSN